MSGTGKRVGNTMPKINSRRRPPVAWEARSSTRSHARGISAQSYYGVQHGACSGRMCWWHIVNGRGEKYGGRPLWFSSDAGVGRPPAS